MLLLEKVTFEEKSGRGKGVSVMDIWAKRIPYRRNSWCKVPKESVCECVCERGAEMCRLNRAWSPS